MNSARAARPTHVPAELAIDFDYIHPPGMENGGVYSAWHQLHDGPDIFWTPYHGGHWVLTRAEDIKWVQSAYDVFSHEVFTIPRPPRPMEMPPVTADPPNHARYRALLNPAFTRSSVERLSETARNLTRSIVERLQPTGRCEFVADFSRIMPVTLFLQMVDLPLGQRDQFMEWAAAYLRAESAEIRQSWFDQITEFMRGIVEERSVSPGTDLISRILQGRERADRFSGEGEVLGMLLVIFLGGLDTVGNLLSFTALHLAENPSHRHRLIEQPEIIPAAVEEYIRRHGLSNTGRLIKKDISHKGLLFKEGEMVMVPIAMSSMDDRVYHDPLSIDFDRPNAAQHNTFGNGPHRCPGALLARAELGIFLTEWLSRIPDFRIASGEKAETHSGLINGVARLPLEWVA